MPTITGYLYQYLLEKDIALSFKVFLDSKTKEMEKEMADFILGGSRITVDDDCSHDIETLAPWKKSYDQPR